MTKSQHKKMMEGISQGIEDTLQDMVDDETYSFTEIKHNEDYTLFDVTISGEELNLSDSFSVIGFYMYGGMYGIYNGKEADVVVVNFYNADGELINTASSDDRTE